MVGEKLYGHGQGMKMANRHREEFACCFSIFVYLVCFFADRQVSRQTTDRQRGRH